MLALSASGVREGSMSSSHVEPGSTQQGAREKSWLPFAKVLFYTVGASCEILARAALHNLDATHSEHILQSWQRHVFAAGDASLVVTGTENLEPGRTYVYMSNHTSLLDVPSMLAAVPGPLRMVGKAELGNVPLWGNAMKTMGFIFVDRQNHAKAIAQLDFAKRRLQEGMSVYIAPEGTRSRTGELLPFKKGGFHLARQLAVPIVPTWIEGTASIVKPGSFQTALHQRVTVRFGAPIATVRETDDDHDVTGVMERVRAAMLALRPAP
jgi:1-acyl-sn-glycerol-3-phosphate acyltransferase